jgi:hypothetical protein
VVVAPVAVKRVVAGVLHRRWHVHKRLPAKQVCVRACKKRCRCSSRLEAVQPEPAPGQPPGRWAASRCRTDPSSTRQSSRCLAASSSCLHYAPGSSPRSPAAGSMVFHVSAA